MTYKIFISQPMKDRSKVVIQYERNCITSYLDLKLNGEVVEIDSFLKDDNAPAISLLGESIKRMADADLVVFAPGWKNSRGCRIEYQVATDYNKPILIIPEKFFR